MHWRARPLHFILFGLGLVVIIVLFSIGNATTLRTNIAEYQWQRHGVRDYHITVELTGDWMNMTIDSTVQNQRVIRALCTQAEVTTPCPFPPEYQYDVPGLFALAHIGSPLAARTTIPNHVSSCLRIAFDSVYQYPERMSYDCPGSVDDQWQLHVRSFDVVP
jgi:hypothetical protein